MVIFHCYVSSPEGTQTAQGDIINVQWKPLWQGEFVRLIGMAYSPWNRPNHTHRIGMKELWDLEKFQPNLEQWEALGMWIWISRHAWRIHNIHRGLCGKSLAPNRIISLNTHQRLTPWWVRMILAVKRKLGIVGMTVSLASNHMNSERHKHMVHYGPMKNIQWNPMKPLKNNKDTQRVHIIVIAGELTSFRSCP